MPPERQVLGKGLEQLLGQNNYTPRRNQLENRVLQAGIERIQPDPSQPRKFFDEKSLEELAASIKEQGLLQPIIVSEQNDGTFLIIAGERRWRAVQKLGWKRMPVLIKNDEDQQEKRMAMALVENLQRQNLNPIEEARSFYWLLEKKKWTQKDLAEKIGRDRSSIANTLRLLHLQPEVQNLLEKNKISLSMAKLLLQEKSPEKQKIWARQVVLENLTVRDLEKKLKAAHKKPSYKRKMPVPAWMESGCIRLSRKWNIGAAVRTTSFNKGEVILSFSDPEQMRGFFDNV